MATITGASNEKVYSIPKWLGLNEHPDGDTRLRMGEAAEMVNWKITRDGNLKRRPGTQFVAGLRLSYFIRVDGTKKDLGEFEADEALVLYRGVSAVEDPGTVTYLSSQGVMTMTELKEACKSGNVYVCVDELPYQLKEDSFEMTKYGWELYGYRVRAIAGTEAAGAFASRPIAGMWSGLVGGKQIFLAACDNNLWSLYDEVWDELERDLVGELLTDKGVSFFPFDGKVYILNGYEYYVYDGTSLEVVDGYRPLVAITISPIITEEGEEAGAESGELTGEYVNRLNGKRRVWISPDGERGAFQMPEKNLASVDWVKDTATGETISGWTASLEDGQVAFNAIPPKGVNSYEIAYSVATTYRDQVTGNLFAELFSGTTDTRVFLYGDGTNRALYSGMDYDGMPRADYFPDQYEVHIGDSNTPITSMIRHYGSLVCYKTDSCWALQHGIVELATDDLTPAIYSQPVNRDKGNLAPGQVRLVNNSPVTCFGGELYQWSNSSYYTSNLSRDERQAKRISDRIAESLKALKLESAAMWDDDDHQEFYVVQDGTALVWNYAADVWYKYEDFDAACLCNFQGELYLGTSTGKVLRVTELEMGDEGEIIEARWESGAIDFGADYSRKYASMLWVGLKPESGTSVDVTVETDRKNTFRDKVVSSEKAKIPGQPFMVRTKIKAKKFVYYRLILQVLDKQPPVTVTNIDFRVRMTGYTK